MRLRTCTSTLLATVAAAACATTPMVKSYAVTASGPGEGYELVGQYGLAKSYVQVTISPVSAAEKKDATPPQIAFTSSISVTTSDKPPKDPTKADETAKGETEASVCADIRKTYNQDRIAVLATYKRHADFLTDVQVWEAHRPVLEEELKTANARLDAFVVQRAKDAAASERLGYLAPLIEGCPQPISIDMKELQIIDQDNIFRLWASHDDMADNNITVEMGGGYLKAINATSEDRTADVIVESSKLLGTLVTIGQPTVRTKPSKGVNTFLEGRDLLAEQIEKVRKSNFDKADLLVLRAILVGVMPNLPKAIDALPIDADLPLTLVMNLETSQTVDALKVTITPKCSKPVDDGVTRVSGKLGAADGILTSSERSCEIKATRATASGTKDIGVIRFVAIDSDAATLLSVPRQPFAKNTSIYSFDNGRLVKSQIVRPSSFVTGVSLPGRAIGGVVSGVTGALDDRTSIAKAETERAKAETERIKAAQELDKLENPPTPEEEEEDSGE